ncbi:cupin domain-containing protein [Sphingomonas sp. So64.6b]|uniref:cupin domain-containing protein n=1 Tax=Sphingomonas sp. So64.6b TaxID=2997354 RepID=UPI001602C750|nr:cupin domain-containing protein [Sphingomonas sp. So64.6b]QNA83173.1 cupin domain-containing protein [Sphingomonas sp. So64.6b]
MTELQPIRRVVTGHDQAGRAIVRDDETFSTVPIPGGDAAFALLWTTQTVPADNNDETDGLLRDAGLTLHHGSVIRIVDMLPGGASPMHRTNSIDYGIALSGQVEMALDDGSTTLLGPGAIIVQRGTMHLWRNPSPSETCRIVFILIEAKPYRHEGVSLQQIQP